MKETETMETVKHKPMRLPAEWEPHSFTQLTWPGEESDWAYMIDEVEECYVRLAEAIALREPLLIVADDIGCVRRKLGASLASKARLFACPTNDTWARDHGAITTLDGDGSPIVNDFQFNGWGLKFPANKDNLITRRLANGVLCGVRYRDAMRMVLEGGSIDSDGRGAILTTSCCLLSDNRNGFTSKQDAEDMLRGHFACDRVLWLDYGELIGDDTDGHVDTLARFAPDDTIVYVGRPKDPSDAQSASLVKMEEQVLQFTTSCGKPYRTVALPCPPPIFDKDDGTRLPATYANFYFVNGAILMPTYGVETDAEAVGIMSEAFPTFDVVPIDCRALIRQHGSLHCSTMQYPQGIKL